MSKVRNALKMAGTWPQENSDIAAQPPGTATKSDSPPTEPGSQSPLSDPPQSVSLMAHWIRRVRRWMGWKVSGPVPRCSGVTRRGVPCRAPAMANGLCRMHGGARLTGVVFSRYGRSEANH